ncbi:MAG: twin-arginine translocation signal domain-containing protein, partial [Pirellulaceae bacterium]|nr:twin-arginine translocation signal domain-containing protein [Pirellulaceae bacterium]
MTVSGKTNGRPSAGSVSRRGFLAGASVAAAAVIAPQAARGYQANSKVRIGLAGCGGRGTWIAGLFQQHGGYELAAVADYFQDRVDRCGEKFGVAPSRRFPGLKGYQRMLDSGIDALVIESPPY